MKRFFRTLFVILMVILVLPITPILGVNYLDGTLKHARVLIGIHVRGRKNKQSKCVGAKLIGSHPGSREEARKNLTKAARDCGKG